MAESLRTILNEAKQLMDDNKEEAEEEVNEPLEPSSVMQNPNGKLIETSLATLELQYFKAVSFYRRRNYDKCVEVCTQILQKGQENNIPLFVNHSSDAIDEETDWEAAALNMKTRRNNIESDYYKESLSNYQNIAAIKYRHQYHKQQHQNIANRPATRRHGNNDNPAERRTAGCSALPIWMMEGVWQLKMRALTQRVYLDDLEADITDSTDMNFERIASKARPESSVIADLTLRNSISRCSTLTSEAKLNPRRNLNSTQSIRPKSGITRPITGELSRPVSAGDGGGRPRTRCGSASLVRATSAAVFAVNDPSIALYQASRLNPTIYAERKVIVKALFQFLYYHEGDIEKAYSLCTTVLNSFKHNRSSLSSVRGRNNCDEWWWLQQSGRCLLNMWYPRKAEIDLQNALLQFPHPDTYLLLSRLYQRLQQPQRALDLIETAINQHPFDVNFRLEQSRLLDILDKAEESIQMYRLITRLNPINIEALACIAVNYFYDNNPEMALMYYRRILFLGFYSTELYCNMGLCCLYGGQIDLVLPCFQKALSTAQTTDQKADIWYNLSFVAINTGDFSLAKRCLNLCLKHDAQYGSALNNLGVLMAHSGNTLKAKSYINAAKEILPKSLEIENNCKFIESHYKL